MSVYLPRHASDSDVMSIVRATWDPYLNQLPPVVSEAGVPSAPRATSDPYLDPRPKRKRAIHTSWTDREPRKKRPQTFRPKRLNALLGGKAISSAFTSRQKIGLHKLGPKTGALETQSWNLEKTLVCGFERSIRGQ